MAGRRIIMFNRVSADGYFAGPDGNLDWVVQDDAVDKAGAANIPDTDTILFGRKTYQMFESFWPNALKDADKSGARKPHATGQRSESMKDMAVWINEATKLVFSQTLKQVTWKNARLIRAFDPHDIEAMKSQSGKDMIVFGSGSLVSQLTKHDLIDEYRFVISPTLLGGGRTLLNESARSRSSSLPTAKDIRRAT
jgi:dihydrofolate reductase